MPPPSSLVCLAREEIRSEWLKGVPRERQSEERGLCHRVAAHRKADGKSHSVPSQHAPWPPPGLDLHCTPVTHSLCCSSLSHSLVIYLEMEMLQIIQSKYYIYYQRNRGPKGQGTRSQLHSTVGCSAPKSPPLAAASCSCGPIQRPQDRAATPQLAGYRGGAQRALEAPRWKARNMPVD